MSLIEHQTVACSNKGSPQWNDCTSEYEENRSVGCRRKEKKERKKKEKEKGGGALQNRVTGKNEEVAWNNKKKSREWKGKN